MEPDMNGHLDSQNGQLKSSDAVLITTRKAQLKGMTFEDTMKHYDEWNATYDEDVDLIDYTGPTLVGQYFLKYAGQSGIDQKSLLLDVGCGTGLVGQIFSKKLGYSNIDGVDASLSMLENAAKKSVYQRLYCAMLGDGRKLPMIDDTYDAAVMSGIFVQGHVKLNALLDVIRLVRPGGLIVNAMREENTHEVEEYMNISQVFKEWEEQGLWKPLEVVIPPVCFYGNYKPLVHVFQVTKSN